MVVPVPATLPDNTLAPADIARKFQSTSLAGLGSDWDEGDGYDGGGGGDYGGGYGPAGGNTTENLCALMPYMPGCPGGINPTPPVYDQTGGSGKGASGGSGSGGAGGGSGAGGAASIFNSILKAGVDISKLAFVTPGTTLTHNGDVSRQNPGYAIPGTNTASLGVNAGGSSSTLLLMLGVGAALYFMSKRQ